MLPPPNLYLNRFNHTLDVINVSDRLSNYFFDNIKPYPFLREACLMHDIGHCCFAHEMEVTLNNFISSRLGVSPKEIGFSHAINGALVMALSANPTKKVSKFSTLNLFKNKTYSQFIDVIVDSTMKHSINNDIVNGLYGKFVCKYYSIKTGHSIQLSIIPKYATGNLVRIADDLATKNSDVLDLIQHYYSEAINKDILLSDDYHYKIANGYIERIRHIICSSESYDKILPSIPEYAYEKELLNISYHFSYKENITKNIMLLATKFLEHLYLEPNLIKNLYRSSRSLGFIKYVFEHSYKDYFGKDIKMSNSSIKRIVDEYNFGKSQQSLFLYRDYLCAIAYEISNFTDDDLLKLFDKNKELYNESEKEIIDQLKKIYCL